MDDLTRANRRISELEAQVKALEDKYTKLINTLPDFIFVFNSDFIFQDIIMPEGMHLLHPKEELIGSWGGLIFTPQVTELYTNNIRECLRTGQMKEIEYHLDMPNNIRYFFQARIVPFEGDTVFALIHDIGDRMRRMEELLAARRRAEEADRIKSAFLANMSHEIRTPLNAIVGFAEVIASENDPEVRKQFMEVILANNEVLLQLINDILDLSRIESGMYEMLFEDTDIQKLIAEITKNFSIKIKPGLEFRTEMPDGELLVFTDRRRVMQVLANFLSNALKNTDQGTITLSVKDEGNHLRLSVCDTGKGIPQEKVKAIFNRFEKVDSFMQGTGLGLSICEKLVERLGGEIGVESTPGKGSTFSFTIPYRNVTHHINELGPQNPKDKDARKRILVGEDSEENFNFIRRVLGKKYDLLWVVNGEEAVSTYILEKPDLILMNIQMPVLNGIDATKRIRAMSSATPIVAITANAFYMEQQWALESGCNDIISKPYSASKLEEVVLAYL